MEGKGSLEEQLEAVKSKASEIATKKDSLRKVEELGAHIEEALIFDNKYVYISSLVDLQLTTSLYHTKGIYTAVQGFVNAKLKKLRPQ